MKVVGGIELCSTPIIEFLNRCANIYIYYGFTDIPTMSKSCVVWRGILTISGGSEHKSGSPSISFKITKSAFGELIKCRAWTVLIVLDGSVP